MTLPSRADITDLVETCREFVDQTPWRIDPVSATDQHAALLRDLADSLGADTGKPDFAAGFIAGICVRANQEDEASSYFASLVADVLHVVAAAQQWPEVATT